ncbi:hypothetical protein [Iningainema tapete]|uniref:PIN domain-containing protein n=1 Tax=Iningainema tapete BLCC-T55 TaxID=2748662 RepID=A0A8J6XRL7_9CYAN|nr:hypothetical protein [Iningainema tapete]MBD2776196.1 hypothetical protein [Iningainema tapete BLCC-T55]
MRRIVLPDSGPLGEIIKPKQSLNVKNWRNISKEKIQIKVVEIIDYEIRRELTLGILQGNSISQDAVYNLNKFRQRKQFIPLESNTDLDLTCELWADLRFKSQGTSNLKNIDIDAILVAQALSQKEYFDEVIIVTANVSDICRFNNFGIKIWDRKQALNDCENQYINFYQ